MQRLRNVHADHKAGARYSWAFPQIGPRAQVRPGVDVGHGDDSSGCDYDLLSSFDIAVASFRSF
jgi:hypothetical protein